MSSTPQSAQWGLYCLWVWGVLVHPAPMACMVWQLGYKALRRIAVSKSSSKYSDVFAYIMSVPFYIKIVGEL